MRNKTPARPGRRFAVLFPGGHSASTRGSSKGSGGSSGIHDQTCKIKFNVPLK